MILQKKADRRLRRMEAAAVYQAEIKASEHTEPHFEKPQPRQQGQGDYSSQAAHYPETVQPARSTLYGTPTAQKPMTKDSGDVGGSPKQNGEGAAFTKYGYQQPAASSGHGASAYNNYQQQPQQQSFSVGEMIY